MEQHPIPQQISSYQFRLVGDMTLKQFFQLAGGLLAGFIFYSSPLLPIIKWPLALISGILGVALAFIPLEERPLEKWIFAFFRAIYTPTLYSWKQTENKFKFFQDETPSSQTQNVVQPLAPLNSLDKAEKGFLSNLTGLFSNLTGTVKTSAAQVAPTQSTPKSEVRIPEDIPVQINQSSAPKLVVEERPKEAVTQNQIATHQVAPAMAGDQMISTSQAIFSIDAAPPNPPTTPNVVVGQVVDQDKKIVEGAIMEIKDQYGRPVRALKSNKVGHFMIVTALDNGKYDIITEKEGYEFSPVNFEANGQIVPPILVQGKRLGPIVEKPIEKVPSNKYYSIN